MSFLIFMNREYGMHLCGFVFLGVMDLIDPPIKRAGGSRSRAYVDADGVFLSTGFCEIGGRNDVVGETVVDRSECHLFDDRV